MKRGYIIALHTGYWLYTLDIVGLIQANVFSGQSYSLSELFTPLMGSYLFVGLTVFYTNYFFVLPRFLKTKRFRLLWVVWILLLVTGIALRYGIEEKAFRYFFGFGNYKPGTSLSYYIMDNLYFVGIFIVISTVFWTMNYWIIAEREKSVLQQQKFEAETAMLKNQVNPHFLFNTLNNIYSLTYKKSDKAPESILKLGDLMRYMLKESSADKVLLVNELAYLNNFIDLQRLRYHHEGNVQFTHSMDRQDYMIAPLLLIPFIENAFKHGVIDNALHPLKIAITAANNQLDLKIANRRSLANKDDSSGIGLSNVKKRLELLYNSRYTLTIAETNEEYNCHLTLNLAS